VPPVFWIGFGIFVSGILLGFLGGLRGRATSLGAGTAIGTYFGLMAAFPLLAIGLATS